MISPTVLNTPHGTEHPPRYCTHIIEGVYLLLVFTFATCDKEKYSYLEQQEYCLPVVTISPDVRQKPSCLWCGKNLLACGMVKTSLPVVRQNPLARGAAKAFLPVVRPAAKAFLPVVRPAARTSSHYFSKQSYDKNKTISQENLMNLVAVAIVLAIVLGHPSNKRIDS